jgi:hypothetical protein
MEDHHCTGEIHTNRYLARHTGYIKGTRTVPERMGYGWEDKLFQKITGTEWGRISGTTLIIKRRGTYRRVSAS